MKPDPQGVDLLRRIGGNPLTVIVAMMLLGGRGTESDVTTLTYPVIKSEKTVRQALRVLHSNNLVVREGKRGDWLLTQGGRQMALAWQTSLLDGGVEKLGEGMGISRQLGDKSVDNFEGGGKFYRPGAVNLINNNDSKTPSIEGLLVNDAGKNYRSLRDRLEGIVDPEGLKLHGPLVHKLASKPGMTMDYIDRHVQQWEADPKPERRKIGMLATKLQMDPAPLTAAEKDQIRRDKDWEFMKSLHAGNCCIQQGGVDCDCGYWSPSGEE